MANLETIRRENGIPFVQRRREMGMSEWAIRGAVRERWPGTDDRTWNALWNQTASSAAAAAVWPYLGENEALEASRLPRPPVGWTGWRYTFLTQVRNAAGAEVGVYSQQITSATSLTVAQLRAAAAARTEQWRQEGRAGRLYEEIPEGFTTLILEMLTVERVEP